MIFCMEERNRVLSGWRELADDLGGSFAARARGVVSPELVLLTEAGEPFGRLAEDEAGGMRLRAGDLTARIEPRTGGAHGMTGGDGRVLAAKAAGSASVLTLRSGGTTYEASISPFRNSATARSSDGGEAARISGGLTNRRYRATFDPQDPASLPVAVFLLHHTFALRSRAYRAGT
jgi:hypothetical protein